MNKYTKFLCVISLFIAGEFALARTVNFKPYNGPTTARSTLLTLKSAELVEKMSLGLKFTEISSKDSDLNRKIGAPALPVESFLLVGVPETLKVNVSILAKEVVLNTLPFPVQPQDCRCATDKVKAFAYNEALYQTHQKNYALTYLGSFRGTPITRLDVFMADYNSANNSVEFKTAIQLEHNSREFSLQSGREDYNDYLVVAPEGYRASLTPFLDWKKSRGYNVEYREVSSSANNTTDIAKMIKEAYEQKGTDFAILIGNESVLPMFKVKTSASSQTPSDLYYFTMDGSSDTVPDIFYSRIAAVNAKMAAEQLAKTMEFEKKSGNLEGFNKIIGIASNEGSNPSDEEYVRSIETRMNQTLGTTSLHLAQDDVNSNPRVLNQAFNTGAFWLTYLGHGSGTSWPSMNKAYSTRDIQDIRNPEAVKSVIIDVACQNGRLIPGNLGTTFLEVNPNGQIGANGAVAYYGGSVNISWHPPAVMAQGIAFEHMDKNFKHLGEALLAGQLYLAKKWSNKDDVVDNMEWYHLQGDPGIQINF